MRPLQRLRSHLRQAPATDESLADAPSADAANQWSHVLRSYLKVGYHAPGHLLAPYLAVELYAWEQWQKTHHFAGVQLRISSRSTLDLFYLFATDKKKPDAHILGLGYDINI